MKTDLKYRNSIVLLTLIIFTLSASCGLPVYEVLDPPRKIGSSLNQVGFDTPDDDLIDGYIIYYKIYYSGDTSVDDDEAHFSPSYYEDSSSEMESGTDIPEDLDFFPLGIIGKTSVTYPHIPLRGDDHEVYFDFTNAQNQNGDPILSIDGVNYNQDLGTPARGVFYTDDIGSDSYNTFKSFINSFSTDSGQIDSDLISMRSSNGGSLSNINAIEIAFVAISYGISESNFEQMMSLPVYLGSVTMNVNF